MYVSHLENTRFITRFSLFRLRGVDLSEDPITPFKANIVSFAVSRVSSGPDRISLLKGGCTVKR